MLVDSGRHINNERCHGLTVMDGFRSTTTTAAALRLSGGMGAHALVSPGMTNQQEQQETRDGMCSLHLL